MNLVLHETYHNTFYATGAHATAFNESLATFVGYHAAIDFFAARPDGTERTGGGARGLGGRAGVRGLRAETSGTRLRTLYATEDAATALATPAGSSSRRRQHAFPTLPLRGKRYEKFEDIRMNNAVLLQWLLYTTDLDVFESLAARLGGVRPALDLIEAAARAEPKDPFGAVRAPPRRPRLAARFRGTAGGSSASSVVARSYFRERSRKGCSSLERRS